LAKTKSEFMLAITQLAAEKNLTRDIVLGVVESALVSAFRKNSFDPSQNISVKLNPASGEVTVFAEKTVVERVTEPSTEISLSDAQKITKYAKIDDPIMVEDTPKNAGRIAAQTAKQVVLQRLREAERELIFEEFADRENETVTGIIQRIEPRQIVLDLGKTEGILPNTDMMRADHYRPGQRLKAYIIEVRRTGRGPQVVVSRTHRNLLRRLLELEVPEIRNGAIELKAIAREAGHRSKIAVAARHEGIDAIGSCVGLRGIRIQNIVNELSGEKIDIVEWDADPATFIANALSPAQVVSVDANSDEQTATVVVPDRQLSLAIGKEGQNARLAARLTGWRIDIKSASTASAEEAAILEQAVPAEAPAAVDETPAEEAAGPVEAAEPAAEAAEPTTEATPEEVRLLTPEELIPELEEEEEVALPKEKPAEAPTPVIRFAEDILTDRSPKSAKKSKKGKKGKKGKEKVKATEEERLKGVVKPKKARVEKVEFDEDEFVELEIPAAVEDSDLDAPIEDEVEQPSPATAQTKPAKEKKTKAKAKAGDGEPKTAPRPKKASRASRADPDEDETEES